MSQAFLQALESIYDATLDPVLWDSAMERLAPATGATACQFLGFGTKAAMDFQYCPPEWDEMRQGFYEVAHLCPRIEKVFSLKPGKIYQDLDLFTDEFISKDEFFQEYLRPNGLFYHSMVKVIEDGPLNVVFSPGRAVNAGLPSEGEVRATAEIVKHLERAAKLTLAAGSKTIDGDNLEKLAETTMSAVVALKPDGTFVESSKSAMSNFSQDGLLRLKKRELAFRRVQSQRRFQRHIAQFTSNDPTDWSETTSWVANDALGGKHVCSLMPVVGKVFGKIRVTGLLLLVGSSARHGGISESLLADLFGLTPKESEVAAAISCGKDPLEIAKRSGRSVQTVRVHLKRVYQKAGVHSKAQLTALVNCYLS